MWQWGHPARRPAHQQAQQTIVLLIALSYACGTPTGMVKRTESGVPLYLVTDFQIIERYVDDTEPEESSGNGSAVDSLERSKREIVDYFPSLLDISNAFASRYIFSEYVDMMKKTEKTNQLQKPSIEEDLTDNHLRIPRSDPNKSTIGPNAPANPGRMD
ncbi:uncharacterized protein [Halyomorpha halys]|uniref:uncharacterized protein isoform X2 n=1 Tax=Halyomorpha halys TaxID=286706 RepID=UPI0006D51751|nr:uncharacterized protein LOC106681300 isoform X2 [Halyomorpha halys]